ncbi:MAG: transcription repressor NadR [Eubacteriales bacterium]|nr:transcription repressor NadR [Eubacteriales bacterium]
MNGEERRERIIDILHKSEAPVSGVALANMLDVSRQVIVQDIALIRAKNIDIFSTNRGYVINGKKECTRIYKVIHSDDEVDTEFEAIIDLGGWVKDVFVYHKVYGVIKADLSIRSRKDIKEYIAEIKSGKSSLLKNVTAGYHYHTIGAEDEKTLDLIQKELSNLGFLAKLQEYEPVDFWKKTAQ